MTDTHSLHRDAMQIADRAIEARRENRWDDAHSLFRQACRLESQAAMALAEDMEAEPTRSVLLRSAATLALNGELHGYAAYLAARGLEGTPPAEIREELRDLLGSIRPEVLFDTAFALGVENGDRLERFRSASSDLGSTLDTIRRTLAEMDLADGKFSSFLIRQIQQAARDGLQKYAPRADFSLDLFGLSSDPAKTWVSVSSQSDALREDWHMAATFLFHEHGEAVLRGHWFAASTADLADHGVISADTAENLLRVGVHGAAAWPVYAPNEEGRLFPGLALLGLSSDATIFADDLVKRLVLQSVSLLELVIVIGRRDEILVRRLARAYDATRPHGGTEYWS
jgi:hypothetical protein